MPELPTGTTENAGASASAGASSASSAAAPAASSTGPVSAIQALEKASAAASSAESAPGQPKPGDTTTAAGAAGTPGASAGATSQPQATGQPGAEGTRGPVPFDRHESTVKNARGQGQLDAIRDATGLAPNQAVTDQHRADVKVGYELVNDLRRDPRAFIEDIARDLKLRIVPLDAQPTGQPGAQPPKRPTADLRSEDGKSAYSAQAVDAIVKLEVQQAVAQALSQVDERLKPLTDAHEASQRQQREGEQQRQASEASVAFMKTMRDKPHFKEHEAAILEKLKAMTPEQRVALGGARAALMEAYNLVLQEVVYPKRDADAEQRVRDNYRKKAAGDGSIAPNAGGPAQENKTPSNVRELSKDLERRFAAAGA